MSLIIKPTTVSEIENSPNIEKILKEYGEESGIKGLPKPSAKMEMYRKFENCGAMNIIGAFLDEVLIGFIVILSPVLPHYGVKVATTESFFILEEHRNTGAGMRILKAAEEYANKIEASGLLVTAPLGSNLQTILPRVGYIETNRVFFRSFNNE